jgi:hypothetical protein
MKITRIETLYLRLAEVKEQCDSGQDACFVQRQMNQTGSERLWMSVPDSGMSMSPSKSIGTHGASLPMCRRNLCTDFAVSLLAIIEKRGFLNSCRPVSPRDSRKGIDPEALSTANRALAHGRRLGRCRRSDRRRTMICHGRS